MRILVIVFSLLILFLGGFYLRNYLSGSTRYETVSPLGSLQLPLERSVPTPAPSEAPQSDLSKYDFEVLRRQVFPGSPITLIRKTKVEKNFTTYTFSYKSQGKKITGQANLPAGSGKFPVVIMVRGYVDWENYFTGAGTHKAADFFAQNGFVTLATDFLCFGGSDACAPDILEARFEKPLAVLDLLASIKNLPQADPNKVFLWAHSNGGQITLSVLEITKQPIPTVLWAPVTKGFPESVTAFMGSEDEYGENQMKVKNRIDEFLASYDPKKYSIDNYFADVQAPIQLHQGTYDPLVPVKWSDDFTDKMKSLGKQITYFKYSKNDHNLKQDWDLVVQRNIEFYRSFLK
ncbi:MAG: prolyl oligopeptidase family serine peptidase [bacterium]|nr:prolyl oligopeptidase family serine peptidase [bacterium]